MIIVEHQLSLTSSEKFTLSKQAELFNNLKQSHFTGDLILLDTQQREWLFYLYLGRLIYATGGLHSKRRWRRQITCYLPELALALSKTTLTLPNTPLNTCWEYDLLCLACQQQLASREQLLKMIKAQITEILFDLTQVNIAKQALNPRKISNNCLILIDSEQVIVETWKLWQSWRSAKIADRSPNSAPIISKPEELRSRTSPTTYQALTRVLNGKKTLREIAAQLKQDVVYFTLLLIPYIQLGLLELIEIPE